jgi:hypothetical protein
MTVNDQTYQARPAVWALAAGAAAIGAAVLYQSDLGLNWFLWIAAASAAVAGARYLDHHRVEHPLLILLGWASLLALSPAVTTAENIHVLTIASEAMLLGLAVVVIGAERWRSLSVSTLPTVPFLAPVRVWYASLKEAVAIPARVSGLRSRPAVRGLLLSLPIALILLALLRNADPVIGWTWTHLSDLLPDWSVSGRVVLFVVLLSLTLGAASLAARQSESRIPALRPLNRRAVLGFTEQRMILVTVSVVLWVFVVLQLGYLVHPPPSLLDSGVTFAEYARRGFAEICVAVTLSGAILMILEGMRPSDLPQSASTQLTRLKAAVIIALEVALILAFRRVILYEGAYGFTTARVYAQAYMVAIASALVALWLEIRAASISVNLGRRLAVIGLATLTVLAFWNHQSWILNRNIDRARATAKFDTMYLGRLSQDVIPTLIARRGELPAIHRSIAEQFAACTLPRHSPRWFEFNLRMSAARRAVNAANLTCTNPDFRKELRD